MQSRADVGQIHRGADDREPVPAQHADPADFYRSVAAALAAWLVNGHLTRLDMGPAVDPIMQLGDVRGRAALRDRCEAVCDGRTNAHLQLAAATLAACDVLEDLQVLVANLATRPVTRDDLDDIYRALTGVPLPAQEGDE